MSDTPKLDDIPVQHKSVCAACPFNRKVEPGALGGSPPETYVGQANGNFRIPCHSRHDFTSLDARLNPGNPECAGVAIFRSNVGIADKITNKLLHLPEDKDAVFASFAEFMAHHHGISVELAGEILKVYTPDDLTLGELQIAAKRVFCGMATFDSYPKENP